MSKFLFIVSLVFLTSCGPSAEEKRKIAAVTCSIMGETRNMDSAIRVREMNEAREKIGGEPFLRGDSTIKEAVEWGLCLELVLNQNYDETVESLKAAKRERERIAAEKRAEEQRIADSKPSVKEEFHPNGKLKTRITYHPKNDGGEKHGPYEEYYANGGLFIKETYKDGKRHGLRDMYYKSGKLSSIENYKDGKRHGLMENYYESGQLRTTKTYKDGDNHGLSESYHENGQLITKVNYIDGEFDGLMEQYYENGQLRSKSNWLDGKFDGLTEHYDENGQFSHELCYEKGAYADMSYCKQ